MNPLSFAKRLVAFIAMAIPALTLATYMAPPILATVEPTDATSDVEIPHIETTPFAASDPATGAAAPAVATAEKLLNVSYG